MRTHHALIGLALLVGGSSCQSEVAPLACAGGTTTCDNACVDTSVDPLNCGGCGAACPPRMACEHAHCTSTCDADQTMCASTSGARCVTTASDNENCGTCGHACGSQEVCTEGTCASTCVASQALCTPQGAHPYCASLSTDNDNCGQCGRACPPTLACVAGKCAPICSANESACTPNNGVPFCTDLSSDPDHCGSCSVACGAKAYCSNGSCACADPSQTWCGACTDMQSDPNNCGQCFAACASGICSLGGCVIDTEIYPSRLSPMGMVADDQSVYLSLDAQIESIPNGGGTPTVLTSGYIPLGHLDSLAMDSTYLYFSDWTPTPASRICKVKKSGGPVSILASTNDSVLGITIDSANVYAHGTTGIYSVPLSGGAPTTLAAEDGWMYSTPSIANDGKSLYWITDDAHEIVSMPVGGGPVSVLYTGSDISWLVAPVGQSYLYFLSNGGLFELQPPGSSVQILGTAFGIVASPYEIYVADLNGISRYSQSQVTPVAAAVLAPPAELAVSTFYVTWVGGGGDVLQRKLP